MTQELLKSAIVRAKFTASSYLLNENLIHLGLYFLTYSKVVPCDCWQQQKSKKYCQTLKNKYEQSGRFPDSVELSAKSPRKPHS